MVARIGAGVSVSNAEIRLDEVTKRFAANGRRMPSAAKGPAAQPAAAALDCVTLAVQKGEIVVVVGPSGCGKSTLLRIVAGLEEPDTGSVAIAGRSMKGVAPQERDVAMVFQGYALYPQMTAREHLEFPLKMRRMDRRTRQRAVDEAAAMLKLEALLDRRPDELSGGERQRVAMGRAIVRKPRVFLFDEPLSNLDASLRTDIRLEIGQLVRRLRATAIYVTHDHVEAMTLADRIAVMRAGKLLQLATPREIYESPATSFVAGFLGTPRMNFLAARVEPNALVAGLFRLPWMRGSLPKRVEIGVRPEHVSVGEGAGAPGEVIAVEPLGAETHVLVRVGEHELRARARGFDKHRRGDAVRVSIETDRFLVFDADGLGERVS